MEQYPFSIWRRWVTRSYLSRPGLFWYILFVHRIAGAGNIYHVPGLPNIHAGKVDYRRPLLKCTNALGRHRYVK